MKDDIKMDISACSHVGTYENENGYCEIYKLTVFGCSYLFAGTPTNNTILGIFDNEGKWIVTGIHNHNSEHDALIHLTERIDENSNL